MDLFDFIFPFSGISALCYQDTVLGSNIPSILWRGTGMANLATRAWQSLQMNAVIPSLSPMAPNSRRRRGLQCLGKLG